MIGVACLLLRRSSPKTKDGAGLGWQGLVVYFHLTWEPGERDSNMIGLAKEVHWAEIGWDVTEIVDERRVAGRKDDSNSILSTPIVSY